MKPFLLISLIGALQGMLLSALFLLRSKKNIASLLLGLYVFVFSAGLLEEWLGENNRFFGGQLLSSLVANSSYLYGPLLYLFILHLTSGCSHFQKRNFIHFLPFFLFFLVEMGVLLAGLNISEVVIEMIGLLQFEILVIQLLLYNIKAIKLLDKHQQALLDTYSNLEERDLRWLRILLVIITSIYVLSFLLSHLLLFGVKAAMNFFILVQLSITLCIYLMSYRVLLRPAVFTLLKNLPVVALQYSPIIAEPAIAGDIKNVPVEKYKKSGLKAQQVKEYLATLQNLMEHDKPFINPDMNIYIMSGLLGISKNYLTQILNEHLQMNFFDFINLYRINEAKKLLLDPGYSHLNLEGIAIESGYRSKTTFFSNFRKITSLTPLEWVRSQKNPT